MRLQLFLRVSVRELFLYVGIFFFPITIILLKLCKFFFITLIIRKFINEVWCLLKIFPWLCYFHSLQRAYQLCLIIELSWRAICGLLIFNFAKFGFLIYLVLISIFWTSILTLILNRHHMICVWFDYYSTNLFLSYMNWILWFFSPWYLITELLVWARRIASFLVEFSKVISIFIILEL